MTYVCQPVYLCNRKNNSFILRFWPILAAIIVISLGLVSESFAIATASPTALTFSAVAGGENPPNQTLTVSMTNSKKTLTASDNASWLTVSLAVSSSSTGTSWFVAAVNTSGLSAGTYNGSITFTEGTSASTVVPVTLTVSPSSQSTTSLPTLTGSPTTFTFSAVQGAENPPNQTLTVSRSMTDTTTLTASDNATWLTVSPSPISMTQTAWLAVAVNTSGLAAGTYNATITLTTIEGGQSVTSQVPVTLTVSPSSQSTTSSTTSDTSSTTLSTVPTNPTSLTFYAVEGATNPPNQTITATKTTASGTLTASDNAAWLTVSLALSSTTGTSWFTAAVNTSGLSAGTYNGAITITEGTSASTTIPVTLMISPSTQSGTSTTGLKAATLTWNPVTTTPLDGYKIYIGTVPGQYTQAITAGNVTSFTVESLSVGITYYFVVTAYNSAGESAPSNEVYATIY